MARKPAYEELEDRIKELEKETATYERAVEDSGLFRNLINESNDAIFVIDPETSRFWDVNDKSCSSHRI